MLGSEFWNKVEITAEITAYDTKDYIVVVTPRFWRELARSDSDRQLSEYSIINKTYGTLESGSNNLPTAIITAKTLQESLEEVTKKELKDANVIGFPSKDRTE